MNTVKLNLDSSVECLTQRRKEAESAENARNLVNTMNYASNLLEEKHHLKGETTNCSGHCDNTMRKNTPLLPFLGLCDAVASQNTPADTYTVVVRCEAAERECARAPLRFADGLSAGGYEGVGLAEGEARAAKRPQGHAREPERSETSFPKMRLRRCRLSQIDGQTSDLVLESKFTSGCSGHR